MVIFITLRLIMMLFQLMMYIVHLQIFNEKKIAKCNKMFDLIKKCFFTGLAFLSTLRNVDLLSCISNAQPRM